MEHTANTLRLTLGGLLDETTERYGQKEALVHVERGVRYSYAALRSECDRVARGLMSLGIQKGDHVGIWATNYPEWVVAQFATAKIGAVLVTVNPAYRTNELEYVLRQADVKALLLIGRFKTSDYVAMLHEVAPELRQGGGQPLRCARLPALRHVVFIPPATPVNWETPPGMWSWDEIRARGDGLSQAALSERQAQGEPDDVINIQYTSGTTGRPKGVMLTHLNLVSNAHHVGAGMNFTEHDRLCIPVPFYHCFGCVLGTILCVSYGATMVIPGEYFDPLTTLQALERERCTAVHGVPTMFIAELEHPDFQSFSLRSLRTGVMAGAPCPVELMRQVIDRMGADEITIAYGLTEASPVITLTRPTDSLDKRVSTVGVPLPGVAVRLVDPNTGQDVAAGQPGELWTRSPMVMKGYYKMPEATAEAIDSAGWLHTGDLASVDADGYYKITGRLKDMVVRGGEKIYPREIEEFLFINPKIADVQIIGVPDRKFGEELMAWVRLKPGENATDTEIREFCRGKIAHYKIPRYVKFVSEFPMTVTGKVQKFKMREAAIIELGLQEVAKIKTA